MLKLLMGVCRLWQHREQLTRSTTWAVASWAPLLQKSDEPPDRFGPTPTTISGFGNPQTWQQFTTTNIRSTQNPPSASLAPPLSVSVCVCCCAALRDRRGQRWPTSRACRTSTARETAMTTTASSTTTMQAARRGACGAGRWGVHVVHDHLGRQLVRTLLSLTMLLLPLPAVLHTPPPFIT